MDRLHELKQNAAKLDDIAIEIKPEKGNAGSKSDMSDEMQEFFADVERIQKDIAAIKEATKNITEININVVKATTGELEHEHSSQLQPILTATNKKAGHAKNLLKRIREDVDNWKQANTGKQTPEFRIKENLTNSLTRKLIEVMKDYQAAQTKYKVDIKKKVKRQVQIVKPDATTEEIDAIFKSGGGTDAVLKNAILTGEAADAVRNAYLNVADKYHDVLTLEASVAELHQMFLDFALLVDNQGEKLEHIEYHIKSAEDFIDQGNADLVQAIQYQIQIRKRQCCIALIFLMLCFIAGVAIAIKTSG